MIVRPAVVLWLSALIICFAGVCSTAGANDVPRRIVEANASQGKLPLEQILGEGRALPPGEFGLKAKVQIPLVDQRLVVNRVPLEVDATRGARLVVLSAPHSSSKPLTPAQPQPLINHDSKLNLLDADELWLTYTPVLGANQCGFVIDFETNGLPYDGMGQTTTTSAVPMKFFSNSRQIRSADIALNGVKVLPRDVSYLIKRQAGMSEDHDWRMLEENNNRVFMRLLRVDMRDIDSIELEMSSAVKQVNFRFSRNSTGKPTDLLAWDAIPKEESVRAGKRWVRLDLASAIKQQMPEVLDKSTPLTLVEMIAFVPLGTTFRTTDDAPVTRLGSNYVVPAKNMSGVRLPAIIERVGSNTLRWRISLAALQKTKLREVNFLSGRIVPNRDGGIAAFEKAELVSLATRKIPVVLSDVQSLARKWGGPFGLANEDTDELEMPKLLAHLPLGLFSGGKTANLLLSPQGRLEWGDMGVSITSRGTAPLALSLVSDGLYVRGSGSVELSWSVATLLSDHTFLSVRPAVGDDAQLEGQIRLRFSEGQNETLPYFLGNAISLHKFAGRRLAGVDLLFNLPGEGGALSIAEMALFTVKVVDTKQAMREPIPTWDWQAPANLWLQPSGMAEGVSWGVVQSTQRKLSDYAALHVQYTLAHYPKIPCWLEVTLKGDKHTIRQQLCPEGLEGEKVFSLQKYGFESNEHLQQIQWKVLEHAFHQNEVSRLQVNYALLNSASIEDRLVDAYRANLGAMELAPEMPTEAFWSEQLTGGGWLNYGDIDWRGGEPSPVLTKLEPAPWEVKEWNFAHKGSADKRFLDWLSKPQPAHFRESSFKSWQKQSLFILLAAWAVILWRRSFLQRSLVDFCSSLLQFLQRSSSAGRIAVEGLWSFCVAQRQTINLLALLLLWYAGINYMNHDAENVVWNKLPYALIVITLFAWLHMWRWRLQQSTLAQNEFLRRWIIGYVLWPPRILWAISAIILLLASIEVVVQAISIVDVETHIRALAEGALSDITGVVGALAGLIMYITMSSESRSIFIGWMPIWIAVFYGAAPWLGFLAYRLTKPEARLARWVMFSLGIYVVGFMHLGQSGENYYFTFGGMAIVVVWGLWVKRVRPDLQRRYPRVAEKVYGSAGTVYFSGAMVGLFVTILLLIARMELISEKVAVIIYYCLVAGVAHEIAALWRANKKQKDNEYLKQDETNS